VVVLNHIRFGVLWYFIPFSLGYIVFLVDVYLNGSTFNVLEELFYALVAVTILSFIIMGIAFIMRYVIASVLRNRKSYKIYMEELEKSDW